MQGRELGCKQKTPGRLFQGLERVMGVVAKGEMDSGTLKVVAGQVLTARWMWV